VATGNCDLMSSVTPNLLRKIISMVYPWRTTRIDQNCRVVSRGPDLAQQVTEQQPDLIGSQPNDQEVRWFRTLRGRTPVGARPLRPSGRWQDENVADDVNCQNCGVQLRRRWGHWQHVVRLGPVACPAAVPETAGHGVQHGSTATTATDRDADRTAPLDPSTN
jgi:hypothetical protein